MSETKRQRNSVIELLRILCILMVIAGHYYAHGIAYAMAPFGPETYSLRILAMQLISFGADIANDLFVIITPCRPTSRSLIIYLTAARAASLICSAIQISTPLAYFLTKDYQRSNLSR